MEKTAILHATVRYLRYDVNDVILRQVMVMVLLYEEYNCTVLLLLNNAAQA